ncbi:MAG: recombination mediator RecR [Actinomycetota bacterium]
MALYIKSIENLINQFRKLPSIGPKTARRIVFYLIRLPKEEIEQFSKSLLEVKEKVRFCRECFNLSEEDLCGICRDSTREKNIVCVVQSPSDVVIIEATGEYRGLYHVLGGLLSPIEDIGPEDIKIPHLVKRVEADSIKEVIIALNPTVEGESTAVYIKKQLDPRAIKVTRLASGLPVGGDLEYADEITLGRAIANRGEF